MVEQLKSLCCVIWSDPAAPKCMEIVFDSDQMRYRQCGEVALFHNFTRCEKHAD